MFFFLALELPNERSLFAEGNGFELSNSEVVHFMREGLNGPDVNPYDSNSQICISSS